LLFAIFNKLAVVYVTTLILQSGEVVIHSQKEKVQLRVDK